MIKRGRRGQDASGPGIERTLIDEDEIVGIQDAGGVSKARCESLCSVAFAANVIAVLANHYFVVGDATVAARINA